MRILIIEDEKRLARTLADLLDQDGYQSDIANDGEVGYELALSGVYAALILDVMLPGMDGFEVLRKRQRSEIFKNIPVIVLTMSDMKEDQELAEQLGADGFLLKPVNPKDAHFRIRQVLGE